MSRPNGLSLEALLARTVPQGECLVWTGHIAKAPPHRNPASYGYGRIRTGDGKRAYVHRLVYEAAHGPVPDGLIVLHSCDNPPCCNPAHLHLGTFADNAAEREARRRHPHLGIPRPRKAHCKHGHEFTPENTVLYGNGYRICRICRIEANRRRTLSGVRRKAA